MRFEVVDQVKYPLDVVFSTMRDHLVDLVPHMPDIASIEETEREGSGDGRIRLVNHWRAENRIPKVVQKFIKPEQLGWIDRAEWNDVEKVVRWTLEPHFFTNYVDVKGANFFSGDDSQTTIKLTGELIVDLSKHPKVPRLLAKSVGGSVEKFVLALVKPNLMKVNRGLEAYLAGK